ncbi:MAG: GAF domain-containing protein [Ktedonobacteraceae bacterium]
MDDQRKRPQTIEEYLEQRDVQERIQQKIIDARAAATVTIGRAASLFKFTENQLRDWELKRGWLKPLRPEVSSQPDQDGKKHRQYGPAELDRLAVIRELIDADYAPAEIDRNLDSINTIVDKLGQQSSSPTSASERGQQPYMKRRGSLTSFPHIDQLIDTADDELFWRFYIASALRLSLMLLHEDNPDTIIGLVLPLDSQISAPINTANIADLGASLIGWLRPDLSFSLLYDPRPSFEQHTDFRMHFLQSMRSGFVREDKQRDETRLVVQRRALPLNISFPVLTAIRRLLAPLYQCKDQWSPIFSREQYSFAFPATDFNSILANDVILPKLMDLLVDLGHDKGWRFACILTTHDPQLPVSQHKLILRTKSKETPEKFEIGTTLVSPLDRVISVSLRAYQGGRICYRHRYTSNDPSVLRAQDEQPIGSVIAVPIGGEEATPLGVIYLGSSEQDAFDLDDQRVLRLMARIVQELLLAYQTRLQIVDGLKPLINNPALADQAFEPFPSETDFITDMENLLSSILEREDLEPLLRPILELPSKKEQNEAMAPYYSTNDVVSFLCFDINDQTNLTLRHGEIMRRNLSLEVGRRARYALATLFTNTSEWKLYQAYDDRYYVLLQGIPLEEARIKAESLKTALDGTYQVDALRFTTDQPTPSEMRVEEDITVRVGASCYPSVKLYELMQRDSNKPYPQASVTAIIRRDFDALLRGGQGNLVGWNPLTWEW